MLVRDALHDDALVTLEHESNPAEPALARS